MMIDRETLERIFSDADIIDVDFSSWSKSVSLIMLSDHWREWTDRKPVLEVTFEKASHVSFQIPHDSTINLIPGSIIHWHVYDLQISKQEKAFELIIRGMQCAPLLTLVCTDVTVRELPHRLLDTINPGWSRPDRGLARPSVDVLYRLAKVRIT